MKKGNDKPAMFRKFFTYAILPALITANGCVRDSLEEDGGLRINLGAKVNSVLVASDTPTKAAIDYDTGLALGINIIRWDEGDRNSVSGWQEMDATMGAPAEDGSWQRDIDVTPAQFFENRTDPVGFLGWYPAKSDVNSGWILENGNVIRSDNTMTSNIDGNTDIMISDFVSGTYSSGIRPMEFSHVLCMFNIYAYAVDQETAEEWGPVNTITLKNLPRQVTISFLEDNITLEDNTSISYSKESYEYNILENASRELHAGFPSDHSDAFIGTILGGAPADGVLGITAMTENQSGGNSVSIARNFKAGHTYNIFLRFSSKGVINAEVSASDWQYEGDYTIDENFELLSDLSRYGTSNSYIVSSANRGYCFTGTVKGNGVNTLTDYDGNTITLPDKDIYLNTDHVGIVRTDAMMKKEGGDWVLIEDKEERQEIKLIELISDKLSEGRVLFRVPGNRDNPEDYSLQYKGNARIAAYDAAGNIIWSWHIWVTDRPLNEGYSNGYVAMDRNLGAVTTDHNTYRKGISAWSGLYYQFGRKDPMFREPMESGNQWGGVDENTHPASSDSRVTVAEAHRHPMTYYYDGTGADGNWTTDSENSMNFWGYVSVRDDIVKTLYDPCPPGYRVPGNPIWENPSSDMTHQELVNGSGDFAGYMFNISGMIDIYYPGTSCIAMGKITDNDRTDDNSPADYVYLHSATPYDPSLYDGTEDSGHSYHFRYNAEEIGTTYTSVLVADPDDGYHTERSSAYPVRCVFENSAPVINNLSEVQTANSYIVSESGFYEFKADVRGNGVTRLNVVGVSDARDFDAGLGAAINGIERIGLLWWQGDLTPGSEWRNFTDRNPSRSEVESYCEQNCPVIILDRGRLRDGYPLLYIRVNRNTYGNVGLAAYDENDNIVWSWHIWIQPEVGTVSLGDFTLMDRNLGATYSPSGDDSFNNDNVAAGYGFYYQWGRKDPFFQPAWHSGGDLYSTQAWFEKTDSGWTMHKSNNITARGSIPDSVEDPLSFFSSDENAWQTTYPTGNGAINDLWGYVGIIGEMGNSFAKTMWDPCPPGYRVMQHDVFESANICQANEESRYAFDRENEYGIYFDNFTAIDGRGYAVAGGIWFPNARAMNSVGEFDGTNYRLSTATPFSGKASREIRWEKGTAENWPYNGVYRIEQDNGNNWMSDGRVVRCQME